MEIPLFFEDEPLRFERILLYPYPTLDRVWARVWLPAVQDKQPNIELRVLNPDGAENNGVFFMLCAEQRLETTLHIRHPQPGAIYRVVAQMTLGLSESPEVLDTQEFEMVLEFRDPEKGEAGFGIDQDQIQRNAQKR